MDAGANQGTAAGAVRKCSPPHLRSGPAAVAAGSLRLSCAEWLPRARWRILLKQQRQARSLVVRRWVSSARTVLLDQH